MNPETQCMKALAKANRVRRSRAHLKRNVKEARMEGRGMVAKALIRPPAYLRGICVAELLGAIYRWGQKDGRLTKTDRLFTQAGIPVSRQLRRLDQLTTRERAALAAALRERK